MLFQGGRHCEEELHTETGVLVVIVRYPGPMTGGRPIYANRFNMDQHVDVSKERIDV